SQAQAQVEAPAQPQVQAQVQVQAQAQIRNRSPEPPKLASSSPGEMRARADALLSSITLADIGYGNGFRLANLGGRRELFLPLPQGVHITAHALALTVDDVSAHEARRSLEILLNDRSVAAIALDGKGTGRSVRIPLGQAKPKDGFLKFSFLY